MKSPVYCILLFVAIFSMAGCDLGIENFESAVLYQQRLEIEIGEELVTARDDVDLALNDTFGTPDEPRWPDFVKQDETLSNVVSEENLRRAAGPFSSDEKDVHVGLYRKHCILCHGISGNGRGPTAKLLNPYPRDFRMGSFKYNSTPIGDRPTRADLAKLLHAGIPGTSMASFQLLRDEDVEALIDYTIYLSVRGQTERALLTEAAINLDFAAGDRLYAPELAESDPEEWQQQQDFVNGKVRRFVKKWAQAKSKSTQVPKDGFIVYENPESLNEQDRRQLESSIARGADLFRGQVANCSQCHGDTGVGNGRTNDYDNWTKDWSVLAGLDPADPSQIEPMLDLGALKPRKIQPRNLRSGIYRGGASPEDLYLRVVNGIEGTPMPAVPMKPDNPLGLNRQQVWDLVNYVMNLPNEPVSRGAVPGEAERSALATN